MRVNAGLDPALLFLMLQVGCIRYDESQWPGLALRSLKIILCRGEGKGPENVTQSFYTHVHFVS